MKPDDAPSAYEGEVARFRDVLARGRSANQLALFDLLVERSGDERSPKEVEIAVALFGNDAMLDSSADSGVRVYVHRLRKRIDDHYRGKTGQRLAIPKGEYRIVLEGVPPEAGEPGTPPWLNRLTGVNRALVVGVLTIGLALMAFAGWSLWSPSPQAEAGKGANRQALLVASAAPLRPLVAVGDSLLLAETEDQRSIQRMILNPAVRTRDDFGNYLKAHPESFYRLYDFNINLAPFNAVEAAWSVQDRLDAPGGSGGGAGGAAGTGTGIGASRITAVSALRLENLESDDVIFVGRLSQLGWLEPHVFSRSRIRLTGYDRLTDSVNGTQFRGEVYHDGQSAFQADYGYLSVRTSSTGRRLIVLAGLGDNATKAVVSLLGAQREIVAIKRKVRGARNFEAVFEVEVRRGEPIRRQLVAAYALP